MLTLAVGRNRNQSALFLVVSVAGRMQTSVGDLAEGHEIHNHTAAGHAACRCGAQKLVQDIIVDSD